MAVTFTREFYINFVLFVVACVALGLSIWAFATPCKKDGFGNSNANLICDFTKTNPYNPIQVNYESGGCSTNDTTKTKITNISNYLTHDISGYCREGSYYKIDLKDDEAKYICENIINN